MPLLALESFGYPGTNSFIYELSAELMIKLLLKMYHAFMNKLPTFKIIAGSLFSLFDIPDDSITSILISQDLVI